MRSPAARSSFTAWATHRTYCPWFFQGAPVSWLRQGRQATGIPRDWIALGRAVNVGEPVKDSKSALRRDRGGTRPIRCRRCTSLSPARWAIWPCEDGFLCRHIFHSDRSPCRRCIWAWSCRPRSMPHTASVIGTGPDVAHQPDPRTATQATASALNKRELLPYCPTTRPNRFLGILPRSPVVR